LPIAFRNLQDTEMKKNKYAALTEKTDKKLSKSFEGSNVILNENKSNRKFSKIFIDFLFPLIEIEIKNKTKTKAILTWGIFVWNKAVSESFPDHFYSKKIETFYPLFYAINNKDLIKEYILRKKNLFIEDDFFIAGCEDEWDNKGNLSISVAVLQIKNNK